MKKIVIYPVVVCFILPACEKESQPAEENENELITTIQLDFTKQGTDDKSTFIWEDPDGPGGEVPYSDTIRLDDGSTYDVKVSFWNETRTPAENITEEVIAESEHHRVYYEPSASSGITVSGLDNDISGMPLGISSVWTTTTSSEGNVTVVLRHYAEGGKEASDPVNSTKSATDAGAIFIVETNQ